MTTDMMTGSLLGRAREASMPTGQVHAQAVAHAPADAAYVTTTSRTNATAVVTNPWLGGFGFGDGSGICPTTAVGDSTKRIHPGRLEGMT
ncbi:MAG: hypothetical protein WA964_08095 [Ilumatobacter sp.]|uniref:hypothetical protein n=1 Tax=Ilumatobacter sp. TaxID=1967498 RepID=UPI003C75346B